MANAKNTKVPAEDAMTAVSALIAKAKREGSIQATELNAQLEKLDLPVEKIEHIYDTFDAMGIQIVSPELEIDLDDTADGLGMSDGEIPMGDEEEELIDPVELAAEYNLETRSACTSRRSDRCAYSRQTRRWSLPSACARAIRRRRTS